MFTYLDSDDRLITTQTPKVQVGGFASPEGRGGSTGSRSVPRLPASKDLLPSHSGREASVAGRRLLRGLTSTWTSAPTYHRHCAPGPPVGQPAAALQRRPGGRPAGWWSVPRWASRRSSRASTGAWIHKNEARPAPPAAACANRAYIKEFRQRGTVSP
ncbi:hypothetical protein ACHWUR_00460 [Klebsiella pneumoniae]